jgi:dienelactone hydrolase
VLTCRLKDSIYFDREQPMKWRKRLLWPTAIFLFVALILVVGVVTGVVGVTLPTPTGPYSVGRQAYDLTDPTRKETFVDDPARPRQIVAVIYYPAERPVNAVRAPYVDGEMAIILAAKVHLPAATAKLIHSHAYHGVAVAQGKFPIVLFLPGIGQPPLEYTTTIEDAASHGYVVVVLYPTYSVPVTVFSDGRVALMSEAGIRSENEPPGTTEQQTSKDRDAIGSVWAADARFALKELSILNDKDGLLRGHLDLDRVGIFGHSFGGATAAEVLRTDQRFKAGINMDGTVFGMTDSRQISQPLMWMASDYSNITDDQLAQIQMTRSEFDAKVQKRNTEREAFLRALKCKQLFVLEGSTHSTYITDEALLSGLIPGMRDPLATIDGRGAAAIVNGQIVAFLDRYLKGRKTDLPNNEPADSTRPASP